MEFVFGIIFFIVLIFIGPMTDGGHKDLSGKSILWWLFAFVVMVVLGMLLGL